MSRRRTKALVISSGYTDLKDFVSGIPGRFGSEGDTLYSGRNTVKAFSVGGQTLVVKHYKRPNIVQRIAYSFFKKSKAERAYLFAAALRERGFNTPHEVAYIELESDGLLCDSYFISANCPLRPLSELLLRPDFDRQAADELASLLVSLHEKGVLHGDLNLTNILYDTRQDGSHTFWLIDTNRSKFRQPSRKDCIENLKRLTHEKPLLEHIIRLYAQKRGWDAGQTAKDVLAKLAEFEHRRAVTGRLKKLSRRIRRARKA